jgi:hypothetical protein
VEGQGGLSAARLRGAASEGGARARRKAHKGWALRYPRAPPATWVGGRRDGAGRPGASGAGARADRRTCGRARRTVREPLQPAGARGHKPVYLANSILQPPPHPTTQERTKPPRAPRGRAPRFPPAASAREANGCCGPVSTVRGRAGAGVPGEGPQAAVFERPAGPARPQARLLTPQINNARLQELRKHELGHRGGGRRAGAAAVPVPGTRRLQRIGRSAPE